MAREAAGEVGEREEGERDSRGVEERESSSELWPERNRAWGWREREWFFFFFFGLLRERMRKKKCQGYFGILDVIIMISWRIGFSFPAKINPTIDLMQNFPKYKTIKF